MLPLFLCLQDLYLPGDSRLLCRYLSRFRCGPAEAAAATPAPARSRSCSRCHRSAPSVVRPQPPVRPSPRTPVRLIVSVSQSAHNFSQSVSLLCLPARLSVSPSRPFVRQPSVLFVRQPSVRSSIDRLSVDRLSLCPLTVRLSTVRLSADRQSICQPSVRPSTVCPSVNRFFSFLSVSPSTVEKIFFE